MWVLHGSHLLGANAGGSTARHPVQVLPGHRVQTSHGCLLAIFCLRVVRVDVVHDRLCIQAMLSDVVDHRVLKEVLDTLPPLQCSPDCCRADLVGDPLSDHMNVTPVPV